MQTFQDLVYVNNKKVFQKNTEV